MSRTVNMDAWHGYQLEYEDGFRNSIHIGRLPGRKQICLYLLQRTPQDTVITPLAYFRNPELAIDAQDLLDHLILYSRPQALPAHNPTKKKP